MIRIQTSNRIGNVEEYYFSKKLAEMPWLLPLSNQPVMVTRTTRESPGYERQLLNFTPVRIR